MHEIVLYKFYKAEKYVRKFLFGSRDLICAWKRCKQICENLLMHWLCSWKLTTSGGEGSNYRKIFWLKLTLKYKMVIFQMKIVSEY